VLYHDPKKMLIALEESKLTFSTVISTSDTMVITLNNF